MVLTKRPINQSADSSSRPDKGRRFSGLWLAIGTAVGLIALLWVLWRIDFGRLLGVIEKADARYIVLVFIAVTLEQLVRGWKWRQLLYDLRPIATLRLFGAVMAGYFANMLAPVGVSPFVRSWLVARLESLKMSTVLATAAIERFVDGVVFSVFVAIALTFAGFPDPSGNIRLGLITGGVGGLILFALTLFLLFHYKHRLDDPDNLLLRLARRLPSRFGRQIERIIMTFARGIIWPEKLSRGLAVVTAGIVIKIIAITHYLWAGLAFGVLLDPADYVFLTVFLGFLIIITRFARIPGGFFLGNLFALDLLGVAEEKGLAMVMVVNAATILSVAGVGAISLWKNGVTIGEMRAIKGDDSENP